MNHILFGTNLVGEFRLQQDYSFSAMELREDCGDFLNSFADTDFRPFANSRRTVCAPQT